MAVKKHNLTEMGGGYYARLYENKSRGKYTEICGEDSRLFSISTHNEEAIKAAITGYKKGLKSKQRSVEDKIQELRVLQMSVMATRNKMNLELDGFMEEIERLLPHDIPLKTAKERCEEAIKGIRKLQKQAKREKAQELKRARRKLAVRKAF